MLKKENKTPIDNKKVNEVVSLSKQVLNILKFLLIIVVVYLTILLLKETGILKFVLTLLKVLLPLFIGFGKEIGYERNMFVEGKVQNR